MAPLVSVIIPAFNAERTLPLTLRAAAAQTLGEIEIIVVDDGSSDGTLALAEAAAALDPRIRVITQANGGVARARNAGLEAARAPYVAALDADDLWRPAKLARQLALFEGRPDLELVYTWYCSIDEGGRVFASHTPERTGEVLEALFLGNFVGNASSALMRAETVRRVGGYDPDLREHGAQGCEDLALFLKLAEQGRFDVVREFLTGYRVGPGAMSSDALQMFRSFELAIEPYASRRPELAPAFERGRRNILRYLFVRAANEHAWGQVASMLKTARTIDPELRGEAPATILKGLIPAAVRRLVKRGLPTPGPPIGSSFAGLPD